MWLFVRRDFVAQYKQTILGPLWHLIQPLFTTIIFLFLFGSIANIPTDGIQPVLILYERNYDLELFFSLSYKHFNTFLANANIFGKVYFPRLVLPLSIILSNIVRFGIQFGLLLAHDDLVSISWISNSFYYSLVLDSILVLLMAGIGLGLGNYHFIPYYKISGSGILLGFAVQLGMYVTPIAYPLSFLKNKGYAKLIAVNPLTSIVECFRYCLIWERNIYIWWSFIQFCFYGYCSFYWVLLFSIKWRKVLWIQFRSKYRIFIYWLICLITLLKLKIFEAISLGRYWNWIYCS